MMTPCDAALRMVDGVASLFAVSTGRRTEPFGANTPFGVHCVIAMCVLGGDCPFRVFWDSATRRVADRCPLVTTIYGLAKRCED